MSTGKHFSALCALMLVLALAVTVLFMNGEKLGIRVIGVEFVKILFVDFLN